MVREYDKIFQRTKYLENEKNEAINGGNKNEIGKIKKYRV
jgi:hypothetical protein